MYPLYPLMTVKSKSYVIKALRRINLVYATITWLQLMKLIYHSVNKFFVMLQKKQKTDDVLFLLQPFKSPNIFIFPGKLQKNPLRIHNYELTLHTFLSLTSLF